MRGDLLVTSRVSINPKLEIMILEYLKIISISHKQTNLKNLGQFVIDGDLFKQKLRSVKMQFNISEIFYLGTCNRVEFIFTAAAIDRTRVRDFICSLYDISEEHLDDGLLKQISFYENKEALHHLLRVSCSLESLVVGEKEIFSQVRKAYQTCKEAGLTENFLHLVMNHVVKTAKEVYTLTDISKKPVSAVSLAHRTLRQLRTLSSARILLIGAGETSRTISQYLGKYNVFSLAIFNRTLHKARLLAQESNADFFHLSDLKNYKKGFDIIITCTGATEPIITEEIYESLLNGETDRKVIMDLAIPNDTCGKVLERYPIHFIEMNSLQEIAKENLKARCEELVHAEQIIHRNMQEFMSIAKHRAIELAMNEVPKKIKEIKQVAVHAIFAKEIATLDDSSREVLQKVLNYIEKKYISIPMIMAKNILIENS